MSRFPPRPRFRASRSRVRDRYVIEGIGWVTAHRIFYVARDQRLDPPERVLLSARWDPRTFDAYLAYWRKNLRHPCLASPTDVFVEDELLFSVTPYAGEHLLVQEPAPLDDRVLFDLAERVTGAWTFLHRGGVKLARLDPANLLISPDDTIRLYDLEVESVLEDAGPLLSDGHVEIGRGVGDLLLRYSRRAIPEATALGALCDIGSSRGHNEDAWRWVRLSDRATLYAVADGAGGHGAGEVASALALETLFEAVRLRLGAADVADVLVESLEIANEANHDAANTLNLSDVYATLVCLLVLDDRVGFVANVGDCRGYLIRDGALHQITTDHVPKKTVERGRITTEEALFRRPSVVLERAVGMSRDVEVDVFRVELEPGDRMLLCSDGLWGEVSDRDLESILETCVDPRAACRELVRAACCGGGKDNVTVLIVTPTWPTGTG